MKSHEASHVRSNGELFKERLSALHIDQLSATLSSLECLCDHVTLTRGVPQFPGFTPPSQPSSHPAVCASPGVGVCRKSGANPDHLSRSQTLFSPWVALIALMQS